MASIRKRSKQGWEAQVRIQGHEPQTQTFKTKADAQQWAREREAEAGKGLLINVRDLRTTRVADLLQRYLTEVTPTHKGFEAETYRLQAMLREPMAALTLDRLMEATDFHDWRERRQAEVSGETVRREMNLLSGVFTHAKGEWRYPIHNPMVGMTRPPKGPSRGRRPTWSELRQLFRQLTPHRRKDGQPARNRNHWVRPAAVLALRTAMRQGEILAMQWKWVDYAGRRIRVPDSKNGTARDVPLNRKAELLLRRLPREAGVQTVFPISRSAIRQAFGDARDRAGIDDLRFHDFRHDATTRIAKRFSNVLELSAVTGHKDLQSLKDYYNPMAADLAARMD